MPFFPNRVSIELKLKFQPKIQKKTPLGRKYPFFSSHTMNFDIKFQPLKMRSDYCHKVLSDLGIPYINLMPSGKTTPGGYGSTNHTGKHRGNFQFWVDLVKKGLSSEILNNSVFLNPVSR